MVPSLFLDVQALNISVIVLKNIKPELFRILPKAFNVCLEEKRFPNIWKFSSVYSVYKSSHPRHNIVSSDSFVS